MSGATSSSTGPKVSHLPICRCGVGRRYALRWRRPWTGYQRSSLASSTPRSATRSTRTSSTATGMTGIPFTPDVLSVECVETMFWLTAMAVSEGTILAGDERGMLSEPRYVLGACAPKSASSRSPPSFITRSPTMVGGMRTAGMRSR
jgi:hypothetical protein